MLNDISDDVGVRDSGKGRPDFVEEDYEEDYDQDVTNVDKEIAKKETMTQEKKQIPHLQNLFPYHMPSYSFYPYYPVYHRAFAYSYMVPYLS